MTSAWGSSWGVSWGNSWGSISTTTVTIDPGAGGGKKRKPGPIVYPAHEERALADIRQLKIERILAERREASAPADAPKPVSMAGGVLVPPVLPPAVTLGDIAPELVALKKQLEATGEDLEDDRRRRILLLN